MKFDCGLSLDKRIEKWTIKNKHKMVWHKWFAWYPVTYRIEGVREKCVWLELIQRKGTPYTIYVGWYYWDYKL